MKKLILLIPIIIGMLYANIINAQWQQTNGPYGGNIHCLASDGTNIFAGIGGGGVFLSNDNGNSWTAVNNGLPNNTVISLAISGSNIFAGTWGGGVYLSSNNGSSWTVVNNGLTGNALVVNSLAISGSNIFAGTSGGGVFLSSDNGNSWTTVNNGLTNTNVHSLVISGTNIFAGTSNGVFLSNNNGGLWTTVGLTNTFVLSLTISGSNIFAATLSDGVFLSNNNGGLWTAVNNGLPGTYPDAYVLSLAISGTNIFAGTQGGGVYLSSDNGSSWTAVNNGLKGTYVRSLAISGTNIFAGTQGGGVYLSSDNGSSWTAMNNGLTFTDVYSLAISGVNIFAGTWGGGVFLSNDNGSSWTAVNNGLTNTVVLSLAVSGTNVFAGTDGGGVFLSNDNGNSWTAVNNGLSNNTVISLIISGTNIFAGTSDGVFLSGNNGGLWTAVNNGLTDTYVLSLTINGTNIFAGTSDGVFLSGNNGGLWTAVNNGLTDTYVQSLAISGTNIFAGTWGSGVFLSGNNAGLWTEMNNGLTNTTIWSFATSDSNIFVGTGGGGVWIHPLSGVTTSNAIEGYVYMDNNNNCIKDSSEMFLDNYLLKITPGPFGLPSYYASTDTNGYYKFIVDEGNFSVTQASTNPCLSMICPVNGSYSVNLQDSSFTVSSGNNFGNQITCNCPLMTVSLVSGITRPCFTNQYSVHYCNNGTMSALNAYINVIFPPEITPVSSTLPWSTVTGNIYQFNLGTVAAGQCGNFIITGNVSCSASLGSAVCVNAHIYPDTICTPASGSWDHSSIEVTGACVGDTVVRFVIKNTGDNPDGNMQGPSQYRIYENNVLVYTNTFQLNGQDSLVVTWPACGGTVRLEADQRPGHPGNSHPKETTEACGSSCGPLVFGMLTQVPSDDADWFVDEDCRIVVGSVDPNEKLVVPSGITSNKYIYSQDPLEYTINFQNTGTDTAFRVVVVDTLNTNFLDIATVQSGAASHPYTFEIYGQGVLEWTFTNILLPDSNTNEPLSHGFFKFTVNQIPGNSNGTIISNKADIYFDFNAPVATLPVWVMVYDTTISSGIHMLSIVDDEEFLIYSNPNDGNMHVDYQIGENETGLFQIYDIVGRKIFASNLQGGKHTLMISDNNLGKGIYFYKATIGNRLITTGKIVVIK